MVNITVILICVILSSAGWLFKTKSKFKKGQLRPLKGCFQSPRRNRVIYQEGSRSYLIIRLFFLKQGTFLSLVTVLFYKMHMCWLLFSGIQPSPCWEIGWLPRVAGSFHKDPLVLWVLADFAVKARMLAVLAFGLWISVEYPGGAYTVNLEVRAVGFNLNY